VAASVRSEQRQATITHSRDHPLGAGGAVFSPGGAAMLALMDAAQMIGGDRACHGDYRALQIT
jgi:hypothetical protein